MVELTGLNLMKGNYDCFEEYHMLFPQRNSKTTDYACQYIQQLSSTIELISFMNETVKSIVDGLSSDDSFLGYLSNHLSARD
jgi:hypothetical protein